VKKSDVIIGAGLYAVALSAAALSLGNSRSVVVLGSPIDLTFEVQPDPGVDLASSCISAQLVSGDVPISPSQVRVAPLPEVAGHSSAVRVQAFTVAREPVLTATITAGCAGRVSRTYTFLAELPNTSPKGSGPVDIGRLAPAPAAPASRAAAESRPVAPPVLPVAPPAGEPAARKAPEPSAPQAQPAPVKPKPKPQPKAQPRPAVVPPQAAQRPRLVMEPLEQLLAESPAAVLRLTPEIAALPPATDEDRAKAAALWKALSADPQEAGAADPQWQERVRALEAEIASMKAQAASERQDAAQLRERLEQEEGSSYSATVVYGLGGALALLSGLLAWLWLRMRRQESDAVRSWRDSVAHVVALDRAPAPTQPAAPEPPGPWLEDDETPSMPATEQLAPSTLPLEPPPAEAYTFEPVPEPAPAAEPASAPQGLQIVNPEELFDILQQAEFFVSVGEHDQAIDVLKQHIADRGETSPFSYLELLRLYHQLGRADDFARLRAQFMRHFNADLPAFSQFRAQGKGLEHYTDELAEIEAQWTSASVLALLEGYLFLQEGSGAGTARFDLAAYDDLLLLLAIAQTTPASARGEPPPRKRTTPLGPPAAPVLPEVQPAAPEWGQVSAQPPEKLALDPLDFMIDDLSLAPHDAAPAAPAEPPLPEPLLDLDLTEPPPLHGGGGLPAMPVTPPPAPGQAVGFGFDDKYELRFELEERPPKQ
jgi:hypothetical protein